MLLNKRNGTFAARRDYTVDASLLGRGRGPERRRQARPRRRELQATTVSVLLNRGDGTFAAEGRLPDRAAPRSVAVGDLNGDGKPDLASRTATRTP